MIRISNRVHPEVGCSSLSGRPPSPISSPVDARNAPQYQWRFSLGPCNHSRFAFDSSRSLSVRPRAVDPLLAGASEDVYLELLTCAMTRELNKRAKLPNYNTIDDAVNLIRASNRILILTGAGIS